VLFCSFNVLTHHSRGLLAQPLNSNVRHQEKVLKRLLQVLSGIFGAVILGAIGSGVWEKILSPALSWLSTSTAAFLSSVSGAYEESIYLQATRDATDLYPMRLAMVIFVMVGLALLIGIGLRTLSGSRFELHTQKRIKKFMTIQGLSVGLSFVLIAFVSMVRIDAAARIKEASLRSIEILRPYVGEEGYAQLRSTYYSVETKHDFEQFKVRALDEAAKAKKKVPLEKLPH
jgi:hypothetical protein